MSVEIATAEYESLRDEILLRLDAQQQLINYAILVGGATIPILGLQSSNVVDPHGIIAAFLVGPIVCIFLQMVYLKHYIYIQQLSHYISTELSVDSLENESQLLNIPSFSGWESHLTDRLVKPWYVDPLIAVLGVAEGLFSVLMGGLYCLLAIASALNLRSALKEWAVIFLIVWFFVDIAGLGIASLGALAARRWGKSLRISTTETSSGE